jgi:hypothetical protein
MRDSRDAVARATAPIVIRTSAGAAGAGGFYKPLLIRLAQAVQQLPRFGFELADEGEVAFGVPV